jgi:hypothetical protein
MVRGGRCAAPFPRLLDARSRRAHRLGIRYQVADDIDAVAVRKAGARVDADAESRIPKRSGVESVVRGEPEQRTASATLASAASSTGTMSCTSDVAQTTCTINGRLAQNTSARQTNASQARRRGKHFLRRCMTRLLECAARIGVSVGKVMSIVENRKAYHDYFVEEKFEAGWPSTAGR